MKYSWHRVVHVRPAHLFKKIVHNDGNGGYFPEADFLFYLVCIAWFSTCIGLGHESSALAPRLIVGGRM
jgi:hypothetical protein